MTQTKMKESLAAQLEPPRHENGRLLVIAGIQAHYATAPRQESAAHWQRFASYLGRIPGQVSGASYGLCFLRPDGVDYLVGVEVSGNSVLPNGFTSACLPAQPYVVFPHHGHVSELHITCGRIADWFPTSGLAAAKAAGLPDFFELYTEKFDPHVGVGGMEVWVPITA